MILQTKDAALFFKLSWSLLYYVNQKYPVIKGLKSPDLRDRDPEIIMKLHRTFYTHMELIDSFVSENPFELNPEDLGIISSWKKSIKDMFYVISHTRNYTLFLQPGRNPKVYGVLGLYDKIEKFTDELPQAVEALLLPFKGKIIYSGVLHPFPFIFEDRKKNLSRKITRMQLTSME